MKPSLLTLVLLSLFATASTTKAATITITDLTDGPPVVTITGTDFVVSGIVSSPEQTTITGLFGPNIPPGLLDFNSTRSVVLTEPTGDFNPPISDIITLAAGLPQSNNANAFLQPITLTFISDSIGPLTAPVGAVSLLETGTPQDLTGLLHSCASTPGFQNSCINISVQSDLATPEVPEPSTWLLFASGLAGMMLWGKLTA